MIRALRALGAVVARTARRLGSRRATAGQRSDRSVAVGRRLRDGAEMVSLRIEVPRHEADGIVRGVASWAAACVVEGVAAVGAVAVVPGEEPRLTAFAPRTADVAARVDASLRAAPPHLHRHLWVALGNGVHLASVVDPFEIFEADERSVVGLSRKPGVLLVVATAIDLTEKGARIEIDLVDGPGEMRHALARFRATFGAVLLARSGAAAAPSATLKRSPQR